MSPALAGGFFTTEPPGKPCNFLVISFLLYPNLLGAFAIRTEYMINSQRVGDAHLFMMY